MAYFDNIITRADVEEYYTKFVLALSMTEDLNLLCLNLSEICSLLDDEKNISTYILTTMKLFAEDYLKEGHPYFFLRFKIRPQKTTT